MKQSKFPLYLVNETEKTRVLLQTHTAFKHGGKQKIKSKQNDITWH